MLQVDNVSFSFANKEILDSVSFTVSPGQKVGIVGRNGAGKTTLFKLILDKNSHLTSGKISLPKNWKIGTVSQEPPMGEITILQEVIDADIERKELFKELENEENYMEHGDIYDRLSQIDAYTAEARASTLLIGLGFKYSDLNKPCSHFSGGWRMRVALASALFANPELLLLDEPSNHLDIEATIWLESYLQNYRGTLVVISHERSFLNSVCSHIAHLNNQKVTLYTGNYDTFEKTRQIQMELEAKTYQKNVAQKDHLQKFVDRFKAKASKAKQAQSRMKMIEKINLDAPNLDPSNPDITFLDIDELAPPLISIDHVDLSYDDEPDNIVLNDINLSILPQDKIGILGQNGNGKSTFIKLLADKLQPRNGEKNSSSKLKVGYFSQYQVEELDPEKTIFEQMASSFSKSPTTQEVMKALGRVGLASDKANNKVSSLSGGEKARLAFAFISRAAPQIFLLDEPTNHLDIDMRKSLVMAIMAFQGAVLIVSHDIEFLAAVCDKLLLVEDGKVKNYNGDLDDYKKYVMTNRIEQQKQEKDEHFGKSKSKGKKGKKGKNKNNNEVKKLQDELKSINKQIQFFHKRIDELHRLISDEPNSQYLHDWTTELANVKADLEHGEEHWLEVELQIENLLN